MKIKAFIFVFVCIACFVFGFIDSVAYDNEDFKDQLQASGANNLWDTLSDDEEEMLERLGIDASDYSGVFNISFRNIADLFYELLRGEHASGFSFLPAFVTVVAIVGGINQFVRDDARFNRILDFAAVSLLAVLVISSLSSCVANALSAINSTCNFVVALVPVLAAVITASGFPSMALTYNSLAFAAAQLVAHVTDSLIRPLGQAVLSFSFVSSAVKTVKIGRFVDIIKKTAVFLFTFLATVFITMLSMKGMLAASADNVAGRGVRFLIGNMVPLVGGAISDAYLSVMGTLALVKNTVAAFAAIAAAVINAPVLVECAVWVLSLNLSAIVADIFSCESLAELFRSVSSALTFIGVAVLFCFLVFLLSLGLVMLIRGSA